MVQFGGKPEDVVAQKSIQTFAGGKRLPAATRAVVLLLAVKVFEAAHHKLDVVAIRVDEPARDGQLCASMQSLLPVSLM